MTEENMRLWRFVTRYIRQAGVRSTMRLFYRLIQARMFNPFMSVMVTTTLIDEMQAATNRVKQE